MRVVFNATDGPLSLRAIQRYLFEMVCGLGHPDSGIELELAFFTHRILEVRRFLKRLPLETRYRTRCIPVPRRLLLDRYARPRRELERWAERADLWHETTSDHPAIEGAPLLTTFHGLCPMIRPDICTPEFVADKTRWFERALRVSDYYTTVSETCKWELVDNYEVPAHKVRSIPLGVSQGFRVEPAEQVRQQIQRSFGYRAPYILYVGGIQKNKNIPLILRVFSRLVLEGTFDGNLVLAGDLHYDTEDFRAMVDECGIVDRVRLPGCFHPDDERLAALYRGAELFLFPTFYEGWTSPPLEAMASGTPVIASSASSVPETVGDAALLADPEDDDAWLESAGRILEDSGLAAELVEKGIGRAGEFTWKRTVDAHIALYRDIAAGRLDSVPAAAAVAETQPVS